MCARERFCFVLFLLTVECTFIARPGPAQIRFDQWTTDNGLPQNSVYSILQTRDGYLWFTTLDGLVRFDGLQYSIFNTGKTKELTSNRFTCLFEDRRGVLWIGTEEGGLVRYERGKFRVIAASSDGVWSSRSANLQFIVAPPFYRTWWFLILVAVVLTAAASLTYDRRIRQLKYDKSAQEEFSRRLIDSQERERKRIAAELHDSLGQSLAIIKNQALSGLHTSPDPNLAREHFKQISAIAAQAIDEAKEIAYNLRPHLLDRLGLTKTINSMVARVARSSEIQLSTDLDNLDGLFTQEEEIHLYRITQEGVNNILKHSEASHAKVAIYRSDTAVILHIQDDGKGIPTELNGAGDSTKRGFGLIGIAERARILGAKPLIMSAPGKGTSITICLALNAEQDTR